jgi:surfeit locus 1 family protein
VTVAVASRRHLLPTTLAALTLLTILLGLGSWQVRRLAWKEGILATIAKSEAGPAQPLGDDAQPYTKVLVEGRFLADRVALYGSEVRIDSGTPVIGAHQIVPLQRPSGLPVLVDRGWLPADAERTVRVPEGTVSVEGYVRPPERRGWFSAADDPARHRFFSLDPAVIGAALGIGPVLPLTLVALASGPEAGAVVTTYPQPATHLPRPPNDHFAYAVTWFSLAAVLVVMFAIWLRGALAA